MTEFRTEVIENGRVQKCTLYDTQHPVTYAQVIERWRVDPDFCLDFSESLARSSFPAFRFETPPIARDSRNQSFEFVLINASGFDTRRTDGRPFAKFLDHQDADISVTVFKNLSGDATWTLMEKPVCILPCHRMAITPLRI